MTRQEARKAIWIELECPMDFVRRCVDPGTIDAIKAAESEHDRREIVNAVREKYLQYCDSWGLDIQADNRRFMPFQITM